MTDQPKLDPSPRPGVMHNFDCTHDPCRCRPQRLGDLIIEHGPYYAAQLNPITAPTAAELNELREELIAARKAREVLEAVARLAKCAAELDPTERRFVLRTEGCGWCGGDHLAELNQRAAEHAEVCG